MFFIYSSTGEEFNAQPLTEYQAACIIMAMTLIKPHNTYHMSPILF